MTTRAVLPIKDFANAKQRLASILDVDERAGLCRAAGGRGLSVD